MIILSNLGNLIIEERRKQHISQDELASRLHVSRQTVSSWESGKTEPGATLMFKLCEELNINFNKFITSNDELKEYVANEKKKTKRKSIFLIIGLIIFFLVIILLLLLVFNSNKFKVYKLSLESDNYSINNGILILSKVNNYFSLGTIKVNGENLNEDSEYYIRIYYKDDNEENLILATFYGDDIVINEEYGYNEYFDDFDTNIDNLYLDISYIIDDEINTETFKFKTEEIMENDIWLYLKHHSIEGNNDSEEYDTNNKAKYISIDSLVNNGYTYSGNWSYEKKIENGGYVYSLLDDELSYYYFDEECSINIYFDLNNNELKSTDYDYNNDCFKNSFIYSYNNKELLCVEGNCINYEDYLQIVEKELGKLEV